MVIILKSGIVLFSKYKIIKIIGQGGMGKVYLAQDLCDNSLWAIKEDLRSDSSMLYNEWQILSDVQHPNIPKTQGVFEYDGHAYMIMEFIPGTVLSSLLKKQSYISEAQVQMWFCQLCDVLITLHSHEPPIVYRDLKPSNIIITPDGNAKLIDFGIAEYYHAGTGRIQRMGLTKGYAAPEQYSKRFRADVRTDIYALGATMHYLLTGKNPGAPPYEFVPVRKLSPDVSAGMESIIKKCLQPNPDFRYASADALLYDLTHLRELERTQRRKKLSRIIGAAAALAIVTGVCFFGAFQLRTASDARQTVYDSLVLQAAENSDPDTAESLLRQAMELQPENLTAYVTLAELYRQHGSNLFYSFVTDELLSRFPNCYENEQFLHTMFCFYEDQADMGNAIFYARQLCLVQPTIPEYWLALCRCQITQKDYSGAEQSAKQYKATGGSDTIYASLIQEIPGAA